MGLAHRSIGSLAHWQMPSPRAVPHVRVLQLDANVGIATVTLALCGTGVLAFALAGNCTQMSQ